MRYPKHTPVLESGSVNSSCIAISKLVDKTILAEWREASPDALKKFWRKNDTII